MQVFGFDLLPYPEHLDHLKVDGELPYPLPKRHFRPESAVSNYKEHLDAWALMDKNEVSPVRGEPIEPPSLLFGLTLFPWTHPPTATSKPSGVSQNALYLYPNQLKNSNSGYYNHLVPFPRN